MRWSEAGYDQVSEVDIRQRGIGVGGCRTSKAEEGAEGDDRAQERSNRGRPSCPSCSRGARAGTATHLQTLLKCLSWAQENYLELSPSNRAHPPVARDTVSKLKHGMADWHRTAKEVTFIAFTASHLSSTQEPCCMIFTRPSGSLVTAIMRVFSLLVAPSSVQNICYSQVCNYS